MVFQDQVSPRNFCIGPSKSCPEPSNAPEAIHEDALFLTNSNDFMSLHSFAILTVLCFIVLPSRSGSRTLGIKDTFYYIIIIIRTTVA